MPWKTEVDSFISVSTRIELEKSSFEEKVFPVLTKTIEIRLMMHVYDILISVAYFPSETMIHFSKKTFPLKW